MPTGRPLASRRPDDELPRAMRLERAGRVVEQHTRGAEVRQLARLLHQRIVLAGSARAVHEPGLELAAGRGDGVRRLAKVRDVVQRIVEPEHVDAVLGGGRDEAPDEVVVHRARADEEAAAQREAERRLDVRLRARGSAPTGSRRRGARRCRSSRRPRPRGRRSPAPSRISATWSCSAVGKRPASGSCPSRRIVVSASAGMRGA